MDAIIDDKVYIGNLSAARSLATGRHPELGITHILSVCPEYLSQGPNHLNIPVEDTEYDDLLIHLHKACRFIQTALDAGGRVLVHCVMGISRSTTVVCAFLMQTRRISASKAISYVKKRRSQVHPNYGFIKQLSAFEECGYRPSPTNGAYISWKRRQEQDVTSFLNAVHDTISVIPDQLYLSSEFPEDPVQAHSLLSDMGMTHVLTVSPGEIPSELVPGSIRSLHLDVPDNRQEGLLLALPDACNFIRDAVSGGGQVLVYCSAEWKAAVAVCAYLMSSRRISPSQAHVVLEKALPLFHRTRNFSKQLDLFSACSYRPSAEHPAVKAYLKDVGAPRGSVSASNSAAKASAAAISAIANHVLSGTSFDMSAFNETLAGLQGIEPIVSTG